MRTILKTFVAAACVAGAATHALAIDVDAPNQVGAVSAWDYQVPAGRVASTTSLSQMPMHDVGYQTTVTDQAPAAVSVAGDAACCDTAGCGDACGCGDSCSCNSGCCGDCWFSRYECCTLESLMGLDCCCDWNIGGWTSLGWSNNNVPLSQAYNDLLSFDDVPDHLNFNQVWFYAEKTTDGSCGCDLGGRVDFMYGTDAQKTQSFGNPGAGVRNSGSFDASWDNGEYGYAMPQLYGEFAYRDLKVKVGHFFTIIGYEVIPVTGNFFRTHSYTMYNSEPFTHTGALASWELNDCTTVHGGWVLGWDTGFDQLNGGSAFLGGITRKLNDKSSLSYMTTYGNFGWRDGGSDDSYSHSLVYINDLNDCWQYVLQSDLIETNNPGVSEFETVGLVNYLFYKINDKAKAGGRMEWWKADGVSFYEGTVGVNLWAAKNIVVRPEYRYDWGPPGIGLDEDSVSIDAILTF